MPTTPPHDATLPRNWAYALLLVFALICVGEFYIDVPIGNRENVGRIIGTVENILLIVAGYIFGSSQGSRAKDRPVTPETPKVGDGAGNSAHE